MNEISLNKIREILAQHGRLPVDVDTLSDDSDLYNSGLTSLATVGLMLALEDAFEVEFPENMLSRKTFESIEAVSEAIEEMQA
jgi:acyl carrier protein